MSKVRQKMNYRTLDGSEPLKLVDWAESSLNPGELKVFNDAVERQHRLRQAAIDAGVLVLDSETDDYVWLKEHTIGKQAYEFKEYDEEWLQFWNRYIKETGTLFSLEFVNEE